MQSLSNTDHRGSPTSKRLRLSLQFSLSRPTTIDGPSLVARPHLRVGGVWRRDYARRGRPEDSGHETRLSDRQSLLSLVESRAQTPLARDYSKLMS